jgi:tRNA-binding protein
VTDRVPEVTFEEFQRVRIHAGTVVEAAPNPRARVPSYVLRIDFGPLGMRTSSAQLTRNYTPEELVGRQVVAVMNFPPKRVAGVKSEVLVLGTVTDEEGVVLLHPTFPVANGAFVA